MLLTYIIGLSEGQEQPWGVWMGTLARSAATGEMGTGCNEVRTQPESVLAQTRFRSILICAT